MKKIIIVILAFVLLVGVVCAKNQTDTIGSMSFTRIAPDYAVIGEEIWIAVQIENTGTGTKNIGFVELLGNAGFNESAAKYIVTEWGDKLWFYEWTVSLPAGEKTTLLYWLVPKDVGTFVFSPAKITVDGQVNFLKPMNIQVMCNNNGKCESGENYLNCPADCNTGAEDGVCNAISDGMCDKDCEQGLDKDCEFALNPLIIAGIVLIAVLIAAITIYARKKK
jgi:hypothetical protein